MLSPRVLRLLAANHIFREVSLYVFANNRLSSVLDTGKVGRGAFGQVGPKSSNQQ